MIKIFSLAMQMIWGLTTVTCGIPADVTPDLTAGVDYMCIIEVNEARYGTTGKLFSLGEKEIDLNKLLGDVS
jgi:hypothetical protein